jgi:anti-sigma factor RsiW
MITCRELIDFLMAYLDGELPPDERALFEEHLHVCPDCVNFLESYRVSAALGKSLRCGDDQISAEVPEGLVQAILAARRKK